MSLGILDMYVQIVSCTHCNPSCLQGLDFTVVFIKLWEHDTPPEERHLASWLLNGWSFLSSLFLSLLHTCKTMLILRQLQGGSRHCCPVGRRGNLGNGARRTALGWKQSKEKSLQSSVKRPRGWIRGWITLSRARTGLACGLSSVLTIFQAFQISWECAIAMGSQCQLGR